MIPSDKPPPPTMLIGSENQTVSPGQISTESASYDPSGDLSDSAWAKMFPSGASKEELKSFIQLYVQDMMREIRRTDKIHKEHMAEQKRQQQGIY